jgi:hypothetical protein
VGRRGRSSECDRRFRADGWSGQRARGRASSAVSTRRRTSCQPRSRVSPATPELRSVLTRSGRWTPAPESSRAGIRTRSKYAGRERCMFFLRRRFSASARFGWLVAAGRYESIGRRCAFSPTSRRAAWRLRSARVTSGPWTSAALGAVRPSGRSIRARIVSSALQSSLQRTRHEADTRDWRAAHRSLEVGHQGSAPLPRPTSRPIEITVCRATKIPADPFSAKP